MIAGSIDIKSLANILCDENSHFASYRRPMMDDRFVYVACPCLLVRVNKEKANERCFDKVSYMADFDKYKEISAHSFNWDLLMLTYDRIKDQFDDREDSERQEQCSECLGSGEVTWEYEGTYDRYEKTDTCPVCDGTGYVERERPELPSTGRFVSMFGHIFYAETIYKLYQILDKLSAHECTVKEIECSMIRFDVSYSVSVFMIFPGVIQHKNAGIEIK